MLYEKINGGLQPITTRPKRARRLTDNELVAIHRRLMELIRQKGFDRNGEPFSADDIVGKNQIDWMNDNALHSIISEYPNSQKVQSSILGLILYQALFEDTSSNYEFKRGGHSAQYCSF